MLLNDAPEQPRGQTEAGCACVGYLPKLRNAPFWDWALSATLCLRALAVSFLALRTSLALAFLAASLRLRALLGSAGMCFSCLGASGCSALHRRVQASACRLLCYLQAATLQGEHCR